VVTMTRTTSTTTTLLDEETSAGSAVSALGLVTLLFFPWVGFAHDLRWFWAGPPESTIQIHSVRAIYWKYIGICHYCLVRPLWSKSKQFVLTLCWLFWHDARASQAPVGRGLHLE
jgi:hypothetical protein